MVHLVGTVLCRVDQIVQGESPLALKPYVPMLMNVVDETLHAKCERCQEFSSIILQEVLGALCNLLPLNHRERLSESTKQTLPIRVSPPVFLGSSGRSRQTTVFITRICTCCFGTA